MHISEDMAQEVTGHVRWDALGAEILQLTDPDHVRTSCRKDLSIVKKRKKVWPNSEKIWFDHLEMEFEAHIWCFSRAHEYYKTTKFQLQTPSLSGRTHY